MPQIKPSRYSDKPKGFITYPYNGDEQSSGLANVFLTERKCVKYMLRYKIEEGVPNKKGQFTTWHDKYIEQSIPKPLYEELKEMGCDVSVTYKTTTEGRKYLTEKKTSRMIPVEIRKIMRNNVIEAIQIRVTGDTERLLLKEMDTIKDIVANWNKNIIPKECVWSQGSWSYSNTDATEIKPVVNPEEILKEQQRLNNKIADMQDKIQALEKPSLIKSMNNERKARAEVLR